MDGSMKYTFLVSTCSTIWCHVNDLTNPHVAAGQTNPVHPWSSSQSVCVNVFVISGNIFYVLGEILTKWTWNRIGVYFMSPLK